MKRIPYKITIWSLKEKLHSGNFEFNSDEGANNYALGLYEGLRIAGKEPTGIEVNKVTKKGKK